MMTNFNELHLILNKYLKWNKSHVKCFTLIMLALIVKQTCNLSSASKALPIKCLPQSFYRRIQPFFAGQYFDYRQISQLIFNMFYPNDLEENAIQFIGEQDGVFNDSDYILFYAEGVDNWNEESLTHVNLFSDRSYYYVTYGGGKCDSIYRGARWCF